MTWRLAVALTFSVLVADACTRIELSQETYFKVSNVVFEGVVTEVKPVDEDRSFFSRTLVTFRVSKAWKGPVKDHISISALERSMGCELTYQFKPGLRYVIYGGPVPKAAGWESQFPKGTTILWLNRVTE